MQTVDSTTEVDLDEQTRSVLGDIELSTMQYTLADAIREGCVGTTQVKGWGNGETACAMHAAVIAAEKRGYVF